MTPEQLKKARRELGLNQVEMAQALKTPYRTYQNWERGERPIPGVCEVAVELLVKKDRWVMQAITAKLAKDLPAGLTSTPSTGVHDVQGNNTSPCTAHNDFAGTKTGTESGSRGGEVTWKR